jgi:membrane carboxypeptidase/penicillin-binding protein
VPIDPRTGDVLAMVGGARYGAPQVNRATQARRQPGSAFTPIVARAALERQGRDDPTFTLASMVEDAPLRVRAGGEIWQPANYDGEFRGPVSFREAMEQSLNVPFARIGIQVGPERVVSTARRLGIAGPMQPVPALALGSAEVTLLELARAYGVFATMGELAESRTMLGAAAEGRRLEEGRAPERKRVADPAATYLVTSTLQGAVERGTARALNHRGRFEGLAGKTGTSNDWRDAWFVAYSPTLVVAVWTGRDDGGSIGMPGAVAALPIAASFLDEIVPRNGWDQPDRPDGIVEATVVSTNSNWFWGCGEREYFLEGTAPRESGCYRGSFGNDWGDQIRERFRGEWPDAAEGVQVLEELYRRWGDKLEGRAARLVEEAMEEVREAARERERELRRARRGNR